VYEGEGPRDGAEAEEKEEIEEEGLERRVAYLSLKATPPSLAGTFSKFFTRTTTETSSRGPSRPLASIL